MPAINLDGVLYFIGAYCNFNRNIEIGASLIKIPGDYKIKLIKRSSGDIFYYSQ